MPSSRQGTPRSSITPEIDQRSVASLGKPVQDQFDGDAVTTLRHLNQETSRVRAWSRPGPYGADSLDIRLKITIPSAEKPQTSLA
jgi:hypothetical protein